MQATSQVAEIVAGVVALLLISVLTLAATRRLKLPFTVALVLVGIGLSALSGAFPRVLPSLHNLEISSSLIFYVFLPTLVFEAAFNLDARQLRENLGSVLVLAIPGLLVSTAVIGLIVGIATPVPLTAALLLGAILSATDPVAVLATFKRLGAPERLKVLVEGESLFNDATAIVLSRVLLAVVLAGSVSKGEIARGAISFVVVLVGGLAVGWVMGLLTGYILGRVEDHFIEITLTTILAYASYLVAEEVLHVSGVMATMAAGIVIGGWGRMKISHAVRNYLEHFWEFIAFVANALIFLMVGLRVDLASLRGTLLLLSWVIVALLVSRAAVIYGLMPLVSRLPRAGAMDRAYRAVIYWGGLRGAIALAVVLSLPPFAYRETFVAVVMGAVLFTLLVKGLSIETLVRRLGLDRPLLADRLALLEADFAAKHRAVDRLPELLSGGLFPGSIAMRLLAQYEKKIASVRAQIAELHQQELNDDEQLRSLLSLRAFAEEKSVYVDLFTTGQLSERSFRRLLLALQQEIDSVRTGEHQSVEPYSSPPHRIAAALSRLIEGVGLLSPLGERLRFNRIAMEYEIAGARFRSSRRVLDVLDSLARIESTPWYIVDKLRRQYQQNYETAQHEHDKIAERYAEFINDMQERLGRRLLLAEEAKSIAEQAEHGALPASMATVMAERIANELRNLKKHKIARLKLEPIALLERMPFFQDISTTDLANIAVRMRLKNASEGEEIARQGERGEHMYFISHGVLRVSRSDNGVSRDVGTLMAGDFFGEKAILTGEPHSATVTAVTECTLYKLQRDDLEIAMASQPAIRKALEEESRKRTAIQVGP